MEFKEIIGFQGKLGSAADWELEVELSLEKNPGEYEISAEECDSRGQEKEESADSIQNFI